MLSVLRRVFSVLFDRSNEAISPPVESLDAALHLPIVAHGPAHGHQTRVQAPIANELIRPELLKQLVFRDHAMAMAQERGACLELQAALDGLSSINGWLSEVFPHGNVTGKDFELLSTALYEACANIAEHGYGQNAERTFELWWVPPDEPSTVDQWIERSLDGGSSGTLHEGFFLIRDHGAPFRADNWRSPDFSDPEVRKRGRGIGLDIIHRAMHQVSYHPSTAAGNITLMKFMTSSEEAKEVRHA